MSGYGNSHIKFKTMNELVLTFNEQLKARRETAGNRLFSTINLLLNKDFNDVQLLDKINNSYSENSKANCVLPYSSSKYSFPKNFNNFLSGKTTHISRNSILTLAFILEFSDKEKACNEMLIAANQLPLHYGGDVSETILAYVFKNKHPQKQSFAFGKDLFDCFIHLKDIIPSETQQSINGYSQRTNHLKNNINLTELVSKEHLTDLSDSLHSTNIQQKAKEWCELNNKPDDYFDLTDCAVLDRLLFHQGSFSGISQKTMSIVHKSMEKISKMDFICFWGYETYPDADGNKQLDRRNDSIRNTLKKLEKTYIKNSLETQPTRIFVILISVIQWCKDKNEQESLKEYINIRLKACSFRPLHDSNMEDAIFIEISKYIYDNDEKKIYYYVNGEKNLVTNINNNTIEAYSSKMKAYENIIKAYISESNIITRYDWSKKDQFFEF